MIKAGKICLIVAALALTFSIAAFSVVQVQAQTVEGFGIPVGGKFLPGAFDIFTFTPICGVTVTVQTPQGLIIPMIWTTPIIYREFDNVINHIGTNMIGLALPPLDPLCPLPILFMFGSSLTP